MNLVGKVMSLLLNMLSRLVVTFLPRWKRLLISWLQSPSAVISNTSHSSKASILQPSAFFIVQLSHPYMTIGKTIALTRRTFLGKVTSLLLNMLSRLVITFLPRSKRLLISWLQSPSAVILPGADCGSDHELLIAKFRLKLKKVGKTTRPFRYDLNQITYDYTLEVRKRFKGLPKSLQMVTAAMKLKGAYSLEGKLWPT